MRRLLLSGLMVLAFSVTAFAGVDVSKLQLPGDITQAQADTVIKGALAKAKEQGVPMNIAVVDAGGNLKAFTRMDGAFLGSIDISIGKARTARLFNMPTSALGAASQPGKELYGIEVTNNGLVIFGGGELLKNKDGVIVGAVGVSGGSVAEDTNVASRRSSSRLNKKREGWRRLPGIGRCVCRPSLASLFRQTGRIGEGFRRACRQAKKRHGNRMVPMPLSFGRRERLICTVELGGGFFVQKRAEFAQESAALEVFFSVAEIEPVVESLRVASLIVLDDGFRLVQRLDEPGFRGGVRVVFPPQGQQGFGFPLGEQGKCLAHGPAFLVGFFLRVRAQCRRNVSAVEFAHVVDQAHHEHFFPVQAGKASGGEPGEQGQPPRMFSRAFAPPARRPGSPLDRFEPFDLADKAQIFFKTIFHSRRIIRGTKIRISGGKSKPVCVLPSGSI